MHITYLIDGLDCGGTEKRFYEILLNINNNNENNRISIITFDQKGYYYKKLLDNNLKVIVIKKSNIVLNVINIYKVTRSIKPDIFHIFNFYLGVYAIAVKLANVKVIFTNFGANYISTNIIKIFYKIVDPIIDAHICNSFSGKKTLLNQLKFKKEKICLIENGIDLDRLRENAYSRSPLNESFANKQVIGCVSNLLFDKDPLNFLKAAKIINLKNKNVIFVLVGSGPYENDINSFIKNNNMGKYFFLLTNRTDGPKISKYFDICVLTSKREGFPNVLLEYMYWGKPCVVTNVGDCGRIVEDDITGKVVEPNSPKQLAKAIKFLLDNKSLAINFGKNGKRKLIKNYSIDTYLEKLLSKYRVVFLDKIKKL